MKIAIASGKGGTGKTTIAANVAVALHGANRPVQLLDCDVEAPNCHLLLRPDIARQQPVTVPVPTVDQAKCDLCGRCARLCAFGAIAALNSDVVVFPELCHSCGGCAVTCPQDAITEEPREVGRVYIGDAGGVPVVYGTLNVGEPQAPPVIHAVKQHLDDERIVLLDAPPGTSCPVVETLRDVDFVVLVAEPTPFGQHDLALMMAAVAELGKPYGLVVNRVGVGDDRIRALARQGGVDVLAELPDSLDVARAQARGKLAYHVSAEVARIFDRLATTVEEQVQACRS